MKVAVIPNHKATGAAEAVSGVTAELNRLGIDANILPDGEEFLGKTSDALIAASDLVIALGGDGTIIHTAKRAALCGKPVLGVNCGHLGFMAGLEANEFSELKGLIDGTYRVETRMMLDITVRQGGRECCFSALNEAVVSRRELSRMIELEISNRGQSLMSYHADGVILSTPTGSTAYSLSAGGPIIDPALSCLLMTPICPHSLHSRAYIFEPDAELHIRIPGEGGCAYLTIDGEEGIPLERDVEIVVCRSKHSAKLIKMKPMAFYEVLDKKLMNRR